MFLPLLGERAGVRGNRAPIVLATSALDSAPEIRLAFLASQVMRERTDIVSDGVMVAQGPLEAFVMVRIHVGQPLLFF